MAEDMTISKVLESRPWKGKHGPMVTYKILLEGHEGPAELNQKPETPPPVVGQSIFAELEPNQNPTYPPKVKKVQQGGFGGGGKSPEQQRAIVRQHSQEMALRREANLIASGNRPEGLSGPEMMKLIDFFVKDVGS